MPQAYPKVFDSFACDMAPPNLEQLPVILDHPSAVRRCDSGTRQRLNVPPIFSRLIRLVSIRPLPRNMGDRPENDRELTEGRPLPHPQLNWKPALLPEQPLKPVKKSSTLPTLSDAFKFVDLRKGKGIFLVTRVSTGHRMGDFRVREVFDLQSRLREASNWWSSAGW